MEVLVRPIDRAGRIVLAALALLTLVAGTEAQRNRVPRNDPSTDPYTEGGNEELMKAAGLVSLGGFKYGNVDTAGIDKLLAAGDIRWIETENFKIGMGLGPYRVGQKEKKKLRAELAHLKTMLPEVDDEAKVLDPWLRAHMYAVRAEQAYDRFVEIMQLEDVEFPPGPGTWLKGTPYMGEGPYLGQKGKYEILLVPSKALHLDYLRNQFGLRIEFTQRWHILESGAMVVIIHEQQGSLKNDTAMHAHVNFNLAHMFLNGYKHYSYDTPIWLLEGLGHLFSREVDPRYNSFDGSEGAAPVETKKSNWNAEVKKLVLKKKYPSVMELVRAKSYGDFEFSHHVTCWSMTKFLIEEHQEGYVGLTNALHGLVDDEGMADSADMPGKHRAAFREHLGWSYTQFEAAWEEWAKAQ